MTSFETDHHATHRIISDYVGRRRRLSKAVREAHMRYLGGSAMLLGSWRTADFHLAVHNSSSFSDVDVFNPLHARHKESAWVVGSGEDEIELRVSIHPEDYEATLRPPGRLALALLNLGAAGRRTETPVEYVRAKAYLVLSNRGEEPAYSRMARYAPFGELALAVKHGRSKPAAVNAADGFDEALELAVATAFEVLGTPHDLECLVDLLGDPRTGISPAFAAYLTTKFTPYLRR